MCWAREANIKASSAMGERPAVAVSSRQPADFFSGRGPARLARHHHGQALRAKYARQFFQLRALAAAVESFEGDEAAAMGVRRHSGNDK